MTSAAFTINGTAAPCAVSVLYGATVTFAATDLVGAQGPIEWTIIGSSKSTYTNPTLTAGGIPTGSTATCTQIADPSTGLGASFVVQCTVRDSLNNVYTQTCVFGTRNSAGIVPLASGETAARSNTHGWVETVNQAMIAGSSVHNITTYGAKTDPTFDSAASIQAAINAVVAAGGGVVYFPPGLWRVDSTLTIASSVPIQFVGEGHASCIGWDFVGDLFSFSVGMSGVCFRDLLIIPAGTIAGGNYAIKFVAGCIRSTFSHVHVAGSLLLGAYNGGGGIDLGAVTDTIDIDDFIIGGTSTGGTGIRIGAGSEVRINGGRILGVGTPGSATASTGILLTGGNGGVHITRSDVSTHGINVLSEATASGTNRELFLSDATLDSGVVGLQIDDSVLCYCSNTWIGAHNDYSILTKSGQTPHIFYSGGTIYKTGVVTGAGHGAYLLSGSIALSGVHIEENIGTGVYYSVTGPAAVTAATMVTIGGGCQITNNNKAADLTNCPSYCVVGNYIGLNTTGASLGATGAECIWEYNAGTG